MWFCFSVWWWEFTLLFEISQTSASGCGEKKWSLERDEEETSTLQNTYDTFSTHKISFAFVMKPRSRLVSTLDFIQLWFLSRSCIWGSLFSHYYFLFIRHYDFFPTSSHALNKSFVMTLNTEPLRSFLTGFQFFKFKHSWYNMGVLEMLRSKDIHGCHVLMWVSQLECESFLRIENGKLSQ